jgi:PTS system beta-glucosides-specific IIC component
MLINPATGDISKMIIGIVISLLCLVAGLVIELICYRDDAPVKKETTAAGTASAAKGGSVAAPIKGKVIPLAEVKDEVFSSEAMGKGVAIEPAEGKVYAPADGEISTFFPTGHAIGITTASGVEILIHVGMDTVEMNGDGFTPKAKQGDKVKKGDLLLEFDLAKIKAAGHPATTPVIITNSDDYADVVPTDASSVVPGAQLIQLL